MQDDLIPIIARAKALRLTEHELREAAGVEVTRYWRAKTNKVGPDAQIKVIRQLERCLDGLEAAR